MDTSDRHIQPATGRELLLEELKAKQSSYPEGSAAWTEIQQKIDQIVATSYLAYLNR